MLTALCIWLLCSLFIAILQTVAAASSCYTCNSDVNTDCGDPNWITFHGEHEDCASDDEMCLKVIGPSDLVTRQCSGPQLDDSQPQKTGCHRAGTITTCTCSRNYCNAADRSSPGFTAFIVPLLASAIWTIRLLV